MHLVFQDTLLGVLGDGRFAKQNSARVFVVKRTLNNVLTFFKMNALLEQTENTLKRIWEV